MDEFGLAVSPTQLETASSEAEFAMQSRHSLVASFALGVRALHSTTGLLTDYMAADPVLTPSFQTALKASLGPNVYTGC